MPPIFWSIWPLKGRPTRTSKQIAEAIENVGGDINAYTSTETTAYHVRLIAEDLPVGIDILTDILQNSTFAKEELEVERGVILQEIGRTLDSPDSKLFDQFSRNSISRSAYRKITSRPQRYHKKYF